MVLVLVLVVVLVRELLVLVKTVVVVEVEVMWMLVVPEDVLDEAVVEGEKEALELNIGHTQFPPTQTRPAGQACTTHWLNTQRARVFPFMQ